MIETLKFSKNLGTKLNAKDLAPGQDRMRLGVLHVSAHKQTPSEILLDDQSWRSAFSPLKLTCVFELAFFSPSSNNSTPSMFKALSKMGPRVCMSFPLLL